MKRTVGSLTHKDFGKRVKIPDYPEGILWAVRHVMAADVEPFTCLTLTTGREDIRTKGQPPETPVTIKEEK